MVGAKLGPGMSCACCEESRQEFVSVAYGDGRILCHNCRHAILYTGRCPHEAERERVGP